MITKCDKTDEKRILSYIGKDYPLCLYLYMDLKKYGFDTNTIDVYLQSENELITSVLLKYYSCLHVYSRDNLFDARELGHFWVEHECSMLYCATETANRVYSFLPNSIKEKATATTGWVAQIHEIDKEPQGISTLATKEDFEQIVRLIYEDDDIGQSYNYTDLAKQIEERNREGYARNLVIKQNDLVIAHACTNAEIGKIAVVAELLVRKEYRRKGYASEIWRTICRQLLSEEKEVFSFYYSEESRALHKRIGFYEVCEWTKIVISRK